MISILIPVYNGIEFINDSVKSIHTQTFSDWELIIGINGHPPDSNELKIAKKYENKRTRVLDLGMTDGKSNALNEMIKYCKYNWVALLDVDDMWKPTKLSSQIPYMGKYDVIGTMCTYFGDSDNVPLISLGDISSINFFRGNPIINSSCLLKKELCVWRKIYDGVEDYDLWITLWKKGCKFYNIDSIQVCHRIHESSAFNATGNHLKVVDLIKYHKGNYAFSWTSAVRASRRNIPSSLNTDFFRQT